MSNSSAARDTSQKPPASRTEAAANPFPGLRPFGASEASLFFGRSEHVEALLAKLQRQRLLAVVGASGSGKSSLVLAGILPRLDRGYRTPSGTSWRIAVFRPGSDPMLHLASALEVAREQGDEQGYAEHDAPDDGRSSGPRLLGSDAALERDLLRIELERSANGLLEAVRMLELARDENLLLVVDQFEELFRFHHLMHGQARDVAAAFVKLLLRASEQRELPIYVMLTLRSDFLGECVEFPGLAEAISEGQYLIPLLNRDQRAEVIRGPVGVAGASISPALVQRLLNDAGDMTDQLPVMQHAMMRTFELARAEAAGGKPVRLELSHYEAAGQMAGSLSEHADQAYAEVSRRLGARGERVVERLFRSLTDAGEHGGGVRRPCKVVEVLAAADCELPLLTAVVATFVEPGRGFLVQQPGGELTTDTTLDISHESLMRRWDRLRKWADEEMALGRQLRASAEAAHDYAAGTRGLLRDPELSLSLKWRREQRLTESDATRYGVDLKAVNDFLDKSARAARRRYITLWSSIGLAFVCLTLLALKLHQSRLQAQRSASEATAARVKAEAAEAEARRALSAAKAANLVRLARDAEAEPGRAAAYLRETSYAADRRGASWHALAAAVAERRLAWKLDGHDERLASASFNADGTKIVTTASNGSARVWETDSGRLLSKLEDGTEVVRSASFSGDGRRIATVSDDGVARLWEVATGKLTSKLTGHEDGVRSIAFGPDGARVATSSRDKTARVWDAATGSAIAVFEGHREELGSASFSRDGKRLVTSSADGTARIWEIASKKLVAVLEKHAGVVHTAEFSPDGRRVATAGEDGTARLWDSDSGALRHELKGHLAALESARFSGDGQWLVTASADKTARIWNAHTGELKATLEGHTDRVHSAAFATDGRVITASWDKSARVWNDSGKQLALLSGHPDVVHSAEFSADGQRIVTCSDEKFAWVWDGRTSDHEGPDAGSRMTSISPGGARIVSAGLGKVARMWDSSTGKETASLSDHSAELTFATFGDGGRQVVTAASDNTLRLWDAATGKLTAVLEGHRGGINALSYSVDGKRLVTGSWDKTALVWDTSTGRKLARLEGHLDGVSDVDFSSDGARIVTASWDGTAKIWESAPRGVCLFTLKGAGFPIHAAAFDPAGETVVTASDDGVAALWNARTGALVHELREHKAALRSAFFSPDGQRVITTSDDKTATIWDAKTGARLKILKGHAGAVNGATFSPDQRWLVTTSADKTARVWDVATGAQVNVLEGHLGGVQEATFSADGSRLYTTSRDLSAGVWNPTGDAVRFIGDGGKARRALVRGGAGAGRAEVWSEEHRRWLDARTVFWQELGLCLSQGERVAALSESAAEAERAEARCRKIVAACRNASPEACEAVINQTLQ